MWKVRVKKVSIVGLAVGEFILGRSKLLLLWLASPQRFLQNVQNLLSDGNSGFSGRIWDLRLQVVSDSRRRSGSQLLSDTFPRTLQSLEPAPKVLSEKNVSWIEFAGIEITSWDDLAIFALFSFSVAFSSFKRFRCSFAFCLLSFFNTKILFLWRSIESLNSRILPAKGEVGVLISSSGILEFLFGVVTDKPSNGLLTTCFATVEKSREADESRRFSSSGPTFRINSVLFFVK